MVGAMPVVAVAMIAVMPVAVVMPVAIPAPIVAPAIASAAVMACALLGAPARRVAEIVEIPVGVETAAVDPVTAASVAAAPVVTPVAAARRGEAGLPAATRASRPWGAWAPWSVSVLSAR